MASSDPEAPAWLSSGDAEVGEASPSEVSKTLTPPKAKTASDRLGSHQSSPEGGGAQRDAEVRRMVRPLAGRSCVGSRLAALRFDVAFFGHDRRVFIASTSCARNGKLLQFQFPSIL